MKKKSPKVLAVSEKLTTFAAGLPHMGPRLTMAIRELRVAHANKKQRTVTIRERVGKYITFWQTFPLSHEDFKYYSHYATEADLNNYLRYGEYHHAKR